MNCENIRFSVRTGVVRRRNTSPNPNKILPLKLKKNHSKKLNNAMDYHPRREFICKKQIIFPLGEAIQFLTAYKK